MLKSLLLFIFLLVQSIAIAQTKFYATISAKEIGKEDYLQLKLIVENANSVEKISNPMLTNFSIESGPNEETGFSNINGKIQKYLALNYILKPKSTGTFSIPSVIAIVNGIEYKSESVTIKVLDIPTVSAPFQQSILEDQTGEQMNIEEYSLRENENIANKINGKIFVKVEVDKKQVYVGEPIVVTYKLYTRLKSESNVIKNPSFNGFSVIDMELSNPMQSGIEKINGKEFNVYVLRKAQIYPLQSGQMNIEKIEVENNITFIKASYLKKKENNFFDNLGQNSLPPDALVNEKINIESNEITINVKPLPTNNVPLQFKGAVGNFTITTKLANEDVYTNTTNNLLVSIAGEGNLHLINAPEIKWPKNFEGFESVVSDEINTLILPSSGNKNFTFPFVISDTGKFFLDSVHFFYFNPKSGSYKKVSSQPIEINVKKGVASNRMVSDNKNNSKNWLANLTRNRMLIITLLALVVVLGILGWVIKDKKKQKKITEAMQNDVTGEQPSKLIDWLYDAKQIIPTNNNIKLYSTINAAFIKFLGSRFDIDVVNLNKQNIIEAMQKNKIEEPIIEDVRVYLQLLEDKLYNPYANVEQAVTADELVDRIENIIMRLN